MRTTTDMRTTTATLTAWVAIRMLTCHWKG
jgi:hypothetical protein